MKYDFVSKDEKVWRNFTSRQRARANSNLYCVFDLLSNKCLDHIQSAKALNIDIFWPTFHLNVRPWLLSQPASGTTSPSPSPFVYDSGPLGTRLGLFSCVTWHPMTMFFCHEHDEWKDRLNHGQVSSRFLPKIFPIEHHSLEFTHCLLISPSCFLHWRSGPKGTRTPKGTCLWESGPWVKLSSASLREGFSITVSASVVVWKYGASLKSTE